MTEPGTNKTTRLIPGGLYPFWFLNGDLEETEIRFQMAEMAAAGMRGFFLHPRQGLRQPYLSEAFFAALETALDAAETAGLCANLYDEFPYPSGMAGGEVTLGCPDTLGTRLEQCVFDAAAGPFRKTLPAGKILSCMAYPLRNGQPDWKSGVDLSSRVGIHFTESVYAETGLTTYNRKRYFGDKPAPVLDAVFNAAHRIIVSAQVLIENFKYWGHLSDVMNPEVIRRFMALTHARYLKRWGERFGRSIHSIFVDETQPAWSPLLIPAYTESFDRSLTADLPALADESHPEHIAVHDRLEQLKLELFCEAFEKPMQAWCAENGLRYTGEKPSARLNQLRFMDISGCEPGHVKAGGTPDFLEPVIRKNARAAASAAYFYEKEGSLCECFHSLGWGATLEDLKWIAEGLMLAGIDFLVPHGSFYTTHGLAKHDAPPSVFFQMPWWAHMKHLCRRLETIGKHFKGTWIDAELLIVDPAGGLPAQKDLDDYRRLMHCLMDARREFLIADTDILEGGTITEGRVQIRDIAAAAVILPPLRHVEPALETWLENFSAQGGTVIRLTPGFSIEGLLEKLPGTQGPCIDVTAGGEDKRFWMVSRRNADRRLWFGVNLGDKPVVLDVSWDEALIETPLDESSGAARASGKRFKRRLAPYESILFETGKTPETAEAAETIRIAIPRNAQVHPAHKNLLRLYDWEMALLDSDGSVLENALVPAVPLANQLVKGGFRFAPGTSSAFGRGLRWEQPPLRIRYSAEFENVQDGSVELVAEPGSLIGDWSLTVNGNTPIRPEDFTETDAHVRGSLGVDISAHLKQGTNRICIDLETDRPDGGLLNALYLAGDFGVNLDPLSLIPFNEKGLFEDHEANSLPHYAGRVDYETFVDIPDIPNPGDVCLEFAFPAPFHQACEISLNGNAPHPMSWSPYRVTVPARELKQGRNDLRIRVFTTLIRSFEGCDE